MFGLFKKSTPKYTHITASECKALLVDKSVKLIDVRSAQEVAGGAIDGHKLINVMSSGFQNEVEKLDKDQPYVVYCKSGMRSKRACGIMAKMGFSNLRNLKGGYMAWEKER